MDLDENKILGEFLLRIIQRRQQERNRNYQCQQSHKDQQNSSI